MTYQPLNFFRHAYTEYDVNYRNDTLEYYIMLLGPSFNDKVSRATNLRKNKPSRKHQQ